MKSCHVERGSGGIPGGTGVTSRQPEQRAERMKRRTILTLMIVGTLVTLGFASSAVHGWHSVNDDAFITYRYASNLAFGHGITWNPGTAPTEGYTNFLLVVGLAPFIKIDSVATTPARQAQSGGDRSRLFAWIPWLHGSEIAL